MTPTDVMKKFLALPPEAQQQVVDFMDLLARRYRPVERRKPKCRLSKEKFVGIWQHRGDLEDSASWVMKTRRTEWRGLE